MRSTGFQLLALCRRPKFLTHCSESVTLLPQIEARVNRYSLEHIQACCCCALLPVLPWTVGATTRTDYLLPCSSHTHTHPPHLLGGGAGGEVTGTHARARAHTHTRARARAHAHTPPTPPPPDTAASGPVPHEGARSTVHRAAQFSLDIEKALSNPAVGQ